MSQRSNFTENDITNSTLNRWDTRTSELYIDQLNCRNKHRELTSNDKNLSNITGEDHSVTVPGKIGGDVNIENHSDVPEGNLKVSGK